MNDYIMLAILLIPVAVIAIGSAVIVRNYKPDADRCKHGKVVTTGKFCPDCYEAEAEAGNTSPVDESTLGP